MRCRNVGLIVVSAVILLALLMIHGEGQAGIYMYKDKNGKMHAVDDPSKIPPEYRKEGKTREIKKGLAPMRTTVESARRKKTTEASKGVDSHLNDASQQKQLIETYRSRKKKIEHDIAACKKMIKMINDPHWSKLMMDGRLVKSGNDVELARQSIKEFEQKVHNLEKDLKKLYREAHAAGVPRGQIDH